MVSFFYNRVFVRVRALWENQNLRPINIMIYLPVKYNQEFYTRLKVVLHNKFQLDVLQTNVERASGLYH